MAEGRELVIGAKVRYWSAYAMKNREGTIEGPAECRRHPGRGKPGTGAFRVVYPVRTVDHHGRPTRVWLRASSLTIIQ